MSRQPSIRQRRADLREAYAALDKNHARELAARTEGESGELRALNRAADAAARALPAPLRAVRRPFAPEDGWPA